MFKWQINWKASSQMVAGMITWVHFSTYYLPPHRHMCRFVMSYFIEDAQFIFFFLIKATFSGDILLIYLVLLKISRVHLLLGIALINYRLNFPFSPYCSKTVPFSQVPAGFYISCTCQLWQTSQPQWSWLAKRSVHKALLRFTEPWQLRPEPSTTRLKTMPAAGPSSFS